MKLERCFYDDQAGKLVHFRDKNLSIEEGDELIIIDNHYESQCTSHGYFGEICKSPPKGAKIITSSYRDILLNNSLSLPFIVRVHPISGGRKDYETNLVEFFRNLKEERRKIMYSADVNIYKVSD